MSVAVARAGVEAENTQRLLVFGAPLLAFGVLLFTTAVPRTWTWALEVDLWLLSYPHVASTFSRLVFRPEDRSEQRSLLWLFPVLLFCMGLLVAQPGGLTVVNSVYFFWQTLHYTRQSRGVFRALRHAAKRTPDDELTDAVLYGTALWGILHRAAQRPALFFGLPLWVPSVSHTTEVVVALAAVSALLFWVVRQFRQVISSNEHLDIAASVQVLAHVLMVVVSYVVVTDPTRGWLTINYWHNAQYLLFVWAWNHRHFSSSTPSHTSLLTEAALGARAGGFYLLYLVLGAAMYFSILLLAHMGEQFVPMFPFYLLLVHSVNFHHYIADTLLWRAPKRATAMLQRNA